MDETRDLYNQYVKPAEEDHDSGMRVLVEAANQSEDLIVKEAMNSALRKIDRYRHAQSMAVIKMLNGSSPEVRERWMRLHAREYGYRIPTKESPE